MFQVFHTSSLPDRLLYVDLIY